MSYATPDVWPKYANQSNSVPGRPDEALLDRTNVGK